MTTVECPEHGLHQGVQMVDGFDQATGRSFGYSETFCVECQDREELARRPYRDHPAIKALREERRALRLTLGEVARRMGVHPARISDLEHGSEHPASDAVAWLEDVLREATQ